MSMATFWMSMTKMEKLSDLTLLEMRSKVDDLIRGHAALSYGGGPIGRACDTEMAKLSREKVRIDVELAKRGL